MSLSTIIITVITILLFGGLSWLVIFLIRKLLNISENIFELQTSSKAYLEHLDRVYNMELFYGNEVLLELLEHSREYHDDIADFVGKYGEGINEKRQP